MPVHHTPVMKPEFVQMAYRLFTEAAMEKGVLTSGQKEQLEAKYKVRVILYALHSNPSTYQELESICYQIVTHPKVIAVDY